MNKRSILMLGSLILSLIIISCNSSEKGNKSEKVLKGVQDKKSVDGSDKKMKKSKAAVKVKSHEKAWKIYSFKNSDREVTAQKYIRSQVVGNFSNSSVNGAYLFVEILCTKTSFGIFLHEFDKSRPSEKFLEQVSIKLKNSADEEIILASLESWSESGGIKIIDHGKNQYLSYYTQLKEFIQKSEGEINFVINDSSLNEFKFKIKTYGFADEFVNL